MDGVDVGLFYEDDVFDYVFIGNDVVVFWVVFVVVDVVYVDGLVVDEEVVVFDFDFVEVDVGVGGFDEFVGGVVECEDECVEVGCFGGLFEWVGDGGFELGEFGGVVLGYVVVYDFGFVVVVEDGFDFVGKFFFEDGFVGGVVELGVDGLVGE